MAASPYSAPAKEFADRLSPGSERAIDNAELRTMFGVSRVSALQREGIVRAVKRAGLEVVSGAKTEPLVVRKPVAQKAAGATASVVPPPANAAGDARPWFKRKRIWALAGLLFFLLVGVVGSALDSSDDFDSQEAAVPVTQTVPAEPAIAATTTETATTPAGPTRSEIEDMVDDDLYAEALAAAALLGNDDENYIARRIANRLARRTMFALNSGDRSRARFLVLKSRDYPTTNMSRQASTAYYAAQERAKAQAAARRAEAVRIAQAEAARKEAERAAEAVPDAPEADAPDTSGPSTTNWCGKRDGDGDGIYCEGE